VKCIEYNGKWCDCKLVEEMEKHVRRRLDIEYQKCSDNKLVRSCLILTNSVNNLNHVFDQSLVNLVNMLVYEFTSITNGDHNSLLILAKLKQICPKGLEIMLTDYLIREENDLKENMPTFRNGNPDQESDEEGTSKKKRAAIDSLQRFRSNRSATDGVVTQHVANVTKDLLTRLRDRAEDDRHAEAILRKRRRVCFTKNCTGETHFRIQHNMPWLCADCTDTHNTKEGRMRQEEEWNYQLQCDEDAKKKAKLDAKKEWKQLADLKRNASKRSSYQLPSQTREHQEATGIIPGLAEQMKTYAKTNQSGLTQPAGLPKRVGGVQMLKIGGNMVMRYVYPT
jgi:hypothetical protein